MNIFVLDEKPIMAVPMLCDCHIRKLCLETAQILSGVMIRRGMELLEGMSRPQNVNHPVIVAADRKESINYVLLYFGYLCCEYLERFGKIHAYHDLQIQYFKNLNRPAQGYAPDALAKCCGDLDVSGMDIVSAYRKYYRDVKKPTLLAKGLWKFTGREDWTNETKILL